MYYPAVVRIFVTSQRPNFDCPWQSQAPQSSTGSGVIIGANKILTGAHVVADATFVQVQKVSSPDKVTARVASVCHDSDLALLVTESESFSSDVLPVEIGGLPELKDRVTVVGYPVGGDEVSVTEGVVSRIEIQHYSHSQRRLLAVTVDAAINAGNSGGPVYRDSKLVGIAFQGLTNAENIGHMVPVPVIQQFLSQVDHVASPVVPGLSIRTQNLENSDLRRSIGLSEEDSGVRIISVEEGGASWASLQQGDALLSINGIRIANNGTIYYRDSFRTHFDVILADHKVGDQLNVTFLRNRVKQEVSITLMPEIGLVPGSRFETVPTYFMYGGMVFFTLTRDFLETWSEWWHRSPKEFVSLYDTGSRSEECQEIIIIAQVLADEINIGYEQFYSKTVKFINGVRPKNMRELVNAVEMSQEIVEVETTNSMLAVFEVEKVKVANERILSLYHMDSDRSEDLVAS